MPRFNNARVLVLGDIMLDRYWEGPTSRISPEAPVPVVPSDQAGVGGSVTFTVQGMPGIVGLDLYAQPMLVAYPNDLRLSNVVRDVIQ